MDKRFIECCAIVEALGTATATKAGKTFLCWWHRQSLHELKIPLFFDFIFLICMDTCKKSNLPYFDFWLGCPR